MPPSTFVQPCFFNMYELCAYLTHIFYKWVRNDLCVLQIFRNLFLFHQGSQCLEHFLMIDIDRGPNYLTIYDSVQIDQTKPTWNARIAKCACWYFLICFTFCYLVQFFQYQLTFCLTLLLSNFNISTLEKQFYNYWYEYY